MAVLSQYVVQSGIIGQGLSPAPFSWGLRGRFPSLSLNLIIRDLCHGIIGETQRELMLAGETSGSKNKLKVLPVVSDELQSAELRVFFKKQSIYSGHILCFLTL